MFSAALVCDSMKIIHFREYGKNKVKFPLAPMGSSLPGLCTRDPLFGPPSTVAEIFRQPCLQRYLETSPPTPQKSYPKFRNPRITLVCLKFEAFRHGILQLCKHSSQKICRRFWKNLWKSLK
jgi:hypothetical protein